MGRDHSFPRQISQNSAGQFAKFRGSPRQKLLIPRQPIYEVNYKSSNNNYSHFISWYVLLHKIQLWLVNLVLCVLVRVWKCLSLLSVTLCIKTGKCSYDYQSSVSFITLKHSVWLGNKTIYMLSCPAVLDAVDWLACMVMGWPSLLTTQLGCIQRHPLLAPLSPAEPSQATPMTVQGTVDRCSCCCHRRYQTTTLWHAHCTITSAICFSI